MDYKNGAVIQIVHTGKTNKDISLSGKIKGVDKLILTDLKLLPKRYQFLEAFLFAIGMFLEIGIIFYLTYYIFSLFNLNNRYTYLLQLVLSMIILIYTFKNGEKYLDKNLSKLPKGLEVFKESFAISDQEPVAKHNGKGSKLHRKINETE